MNYKHSCVVDATGLYVTLVLVLMEPNENGAEQPKIQHYTLKNEESLVDTAPPTLRPYAGAVGFVTPQWTGEVWAEAATENEITTWEADHPAPAETENTVMATTQLMLAVAELAQTMETDNTANQLAIAELAATLLGGAT